ncbi:MULTISPECIES: hypothetical protein [Streptomyces]|uniref:Uncharacterized protein n=1 Tax=Streptomyces gilvifuscus TaxID=1550617 RepID=A0ABT5FPI4_9ACTN|nr:MULTISPECIES: hypothetical protein [Streptomyces]MDC2954403.1 hypothetical protein [Streptomyces gilvifuscus]
MARPKLLAGAYRASRPRRLQSGHLGDHVAWMLVGAALLGAPGS